GPRTVRRSWWSVTLSAAGRPARGHMPRAIAPPRRGARTLRREQRGGEKFLHRLLRRGVGLLVVRDGRAELDAGIGVGEGLRGLHVDDHAVLPLGELATARRLRLFGHDRRLEE